VTANTHRMTPEEIDTVWLPLEGEFSYYKGLAGDARRALADPETKSYDRYSHEHTIERTAPKIEELRAAVEPYREEWKRRGGWTRYPYVTNLGGHYHRDTSCSTCHPTTSFAIHPHTSGATESELIEKVGHHACTTCFPQAPSLPSWQRTLREEGAAKHATAVEKWEKGHATRVKKVANVTKRLAKHIASGDHDHCTRYRGGDCWDEKDLGYAKQELARWEAKRPA
jgi:hypothetical protein